MRQKSKNQAQESDYYYKGRVSGSKRELKKLVSSAEMRLLEKYDIIMINESLADATRCKQFEIILSLTRLLSKKSWLSLTQDDIDNLVSNVMRTYSDNGKVTNTTYDHKKILKIFFRWLKLDSRSFRDVGNPPELKNVKQKQVAEKIVREELVTENDLNNLLSVCSNLRDKALLHVQYEAGTRPGELLSLQLKHVKSDKYGMIIAVDGKTGARPIRLIESVPSLSKWIASHPYKDNTESPLWINTSHTNYGKRLSHASATRILYQACRKSKIGKKINLKLFRHSEATRTATFMTEATLRKRHGWSATSKMPAKYAHINQKDVEDALLSHYGIVQEEEKAKRVPKICSVCKNPNSFDANICDNCSKPLDLKTAIEQEEAEKEAKQNWINEVEKSKERIKIHEQEIELMKMKIDHKSIETINNKDNEIDNLKKEMTEMKKLLKEFFNSK